MMPACLKQPRPALQGPSEKGAQRSAAVSAKTVETCFCLRKQHVKQQHFGVQALMEEVTKQALAARGPREEAQPPSGGKRHSSRAGEPREAKGSPA